VGAIDSVSRPVPLDSDGDSIADRVLIAVGDDAANVVTVLVTTDLAGWGTWSVLSTPVTADFQSLGSLVVANQSLFLIYSSDSDDLQVRSSLDFGATFGGFIASIAARAEGGGRQSPRAIATQSGKIAVVMLEGDSDGVVRDHVHIHTGSDGATWSSAKEIWGEDDVNWRDPDLVQLANGRTIVTAFRGGSTPGIYARSTTAADPATGSFSDWGTSAPALPAPVSTRDQPTLCVAPDAGLLLMCRETSGTTFLQRSRLTDVGGDFTPFIDAVRTAEDLAMPQVNAIGGAFWCAFVNATRGDAEMVVALDH
jgi:hypothetical protein